MIPEDEARMDKEDKSPPLAMTFTEQQWIVIGTAISRRLQAPDCDSIEEENLRPTRQGKV
jgi:hypothetical protein